MTSLITSKIAQKQYAFKLAEKRFDGVISPEIEQQAIAAFPDAGFKEKYQDYLNLTVDNFSSLVIEPML
jgi:hypothetical protein